MIKKKGGLSEQSWSLSEESSVGTRAPRKAGTNAGTLPVHLHRVGCSLVFPLCRQQLFLSLSTPRSRSWLVQSMYHAPIKTQGLLVPDLS